VTSAAPEKLWDPPAELVERSRMTEFMRWLEAERGLRFDGYDELWRWSVTDLEAFWASIWDFFGVQADGGYDRVLASREMPGAEWFASTSLNYAEHVFAGKDDAEPAILHASELRELGELSWGELRAGVAAVAAGLRELGVERGDRVVAYLPNVPEAIVAFLATASIGAVWSSCSPDFGPASVIDRFAQIEPKVLFAVDGYRYGGKDFDRRDVLAELQAAMPSLVRTVVLPYLDPDPDLAGLRDVTRWDELLAAGEGAEPAFERVPFDHPLWVLYSSGTTGLPKAIVQGQGGILLEHLKKLHLHVDAHPGDRLFWFTTTGWMMWNFLVSGLLTRAAIVLYDGNPGHPDMSVLWDLAARAGVTMFGTSASYIAACMKAGVEPAGSGRDLSRLKAVGSTGSPLAPEGFDWIYAQLGADTWLFSTSGGTDLCTAFVGGTPLLPVYRGELQARALGAAVEAWDEDGNSVIDEVGELVVTEPMPSMPVLFWGDDDGSRYRAAYFERIPGVWHQGDFAEWTEHGGVVIHGRSDATLNPGGVRIGTAEIYRQVDAIAGVQESLVIGQRWDDDVRIVLFVVLPDGAALDDELAATIRRRIRTGASPRHVPARIVAVPDLPRTRSGKLTELAVRAVVHGEPVKNTEALANPEVLEHFRDREELQG
jgi:acetoacetyl-CoA synthetase